MFKKYLKINKTALVVIILLVVAIPLLVIYPNKKVSSQAYEMPVLNLPLRYFQDSDIRGGYYSGKGDSAYKNTMSSAYLDGGYRSFPTTTIKLSSDDYSNKREKLPAIKLQDQILPENLDEGFVYKESFTEQIQKYGALATRFLTDDYIVDLQKFDVDGDGKDETIVFLCGLGGNHCPHRIIVIENDTIIFSFSAGLTDRNLIKSETGNGFYVHWVPIENDTKWDAPLCCSPGYISTRFVYENGKFKPVYEQEVLYFEVKNTEQ